MLTAAAAWLIHRSNARNGRPTPGLAAVSGLKSNSVGRFLTGLVNRNAAEAGASADLTELLELRGIILSRKRPVAMINTTAFEQGERAPMLLASREYSIQCVDIGSDTVRIQADAREPITLQLKGRL
jgi:hypothetical protein